MVLPREIALCCLLLTLSLNGRAQRIEKVGDSVVEPNALYFTRGTWGNCVNGQSFQQDALTSFRGWQYATYYDSARRVCLARRPSDADSWEVIRFEDHHLKGNDTHNVTVLGICARD